MYKLNEGSLKLSLLKTCICDIENLNHKVLLQNCLISNASKFNELKLVSNRRRIKNPLFLYLVLCAHKTKSRKKKFFTTRLQSTPIGNQL